MTNESNQHGDNSWLNDTPHSDRIWLNMLVDGELSVSQRQAYIAYIAENDDWQKVATTFLDEQVLVAHVVSPVGADSEIAVAAPVEPTPIRHTAQYLTMTACLLFGLMVGSWLQRGENIVDVVDVPRPAEPVGSDRIEEENAAFHPSLPGLYQVSDTAHEAIYYADFSLPQFMLDALVLAGHRVTFDQEFLGYTETSDNPAAVPINVIHIQKYGRLLAALE